MAGMPDEIGALKPGVAADVSVLDDMRGLFKLQDNEKTVVIAERSAGTRLLPACGTPLRRDGAYSAQCGGALACAMPSAFRSGTGRVCSWYHGCHQRGAARLN